MPAPINEFDEYWTARYLTAPEATYRIFGFDITRKEPSVSCLPVHLQETRFHTQFSRIRNNESSMSLLRRYFHRPTGTFIHEDREFSFENLTYMDYFKMFRYEKWDQSKVDGIRYFQESSMPIGEPRQLVILRTGRVTHITRLAPAKPSEGERFYVRVILQRKPARSFDDLRTHDGYLYPFFQHAAISMGIFISEQEAEYAMTEAVLSRMYTPAELRRLFVDILVNDCSQTPLTLWERFAHDMSNDHIINLGSDERGIAYALHLIAEALQEYGKQPSDYGLPYRNNFSGELEEELLRWAPQIHSFAAQSEQAYASFNIDQRRIFDEIMRSVSSREPLLLFIDGKAGRGKTFLLNTICRKLRSQGRIVIATAVSAFAAQLYDGGRTAHSVFKVNIYISFDIIMSNSNQRYPSTSIMNYSNLTFHFTLHVPI